MRIVVWVSVFMAYLLVFVGIFTLLSNITKGFEVEIEEKFEIRGEAKTRTRAVEFNEVPAVKWGFGMSGLLIAVGAGYMAANSLAKNWSGDDERKVTKTEKLIWAGVFGAVFFASSFSFGIHSIDAIFELKGLLFMAVTCAAAYMISTAICKLVGNKHEAVTAESEG